MNIFDYLGEENINKIENFEKEIIGKSNEEIRELEIKYFSTNKKNLSFIDKGVIKDKIKEMSLNL